MKPIVAIVGRPNVGKSTLFNRLAGERIAITDDAPGVTRDRIYADCEWAGKAFTLIDTGGLDPSANDIILKQIYNQAEIAIDSADVILFLTDVTAGITDDDEKIALVLRKSRKPIVLAVNKVDNMRAQNLDVYEFYRLALGEPYAVSAGQALALGELLDAVVSHFKTPANTEDDDNIVKIAVVGKPNVGKSSLINKILGEERMIVSQVPGTTRDAVDSYIENDSGKYIIIDTAGIRRKAKIKENIERYSVVRALAAVERANVCLTLISAEEGISEQDVKNAALAHEAGKASVIVVNKWDLIEKDSKTADKFAKEIDTALSFMPYAPKIFISAKSGQRVHKLFGLINTVWQNSCLRVSTGVLNEALGEAIAITPPPSDRGRSLKVYYSTQVSVCPPVFAVFVNDKDLMHFSYKRFLENQIRQNFGFAGTPIVISVKNRKDS